MRFKDQRTIRRRRKNQGQNYTRLFLKGRPGKKLDLDLDLDLDLVLCTVTW